MKRIHIMSLAILAIFVGAIFAQTSVPSTATAQTTLTNTLQGICSLAATILPVIAFVLFILAGVAYAAGQFFGADTRAKSIGWAMNMITGAVIAFLLWIIGPLIIAGLSGNTYTIGATSCSGPNFG